MKKSVGFINYVYYDKIWRTVSGVTYVNSPRYFRVILAEYFIRFYVSESEQLCWKEQAVRQFISNLCFFSLLSKNSIDKKSFDTQILNKIFSIKIISTKNIWQTNIFEEIPVNSVKSSWSYLTGGQTDKAQTEADTFWKR